MVSVEWSFFMTRASVGSTGCVAAWLGAVTGILMIGFAGPILYGCRIVSMTPFEVVVGQGVDDSCL